LELSQLDRRYAGLRAPNARRQSELLASVLAHGQQVPVVVVRDEEPERYVLIDGYARVAALETLHADEVVAVVWDLPEPHALALSHRLDHAQARSALEEGWLLRELERVHGLSLGALALLLGRSRSWVSRRLGLVTTLPASVQDAVRAGRLSAQAAQKYLVPLARANTRDCETLVWSLAPEPTTVRQMRELYVGYQRGNAEVRARIVTEPRLFLRALAATGGDTEGERAGDDLVRDLTILESVSRRAQRRLDDEPLAGRPLVRDRAQRRWRATDRAFRALADRMREDIDDAGLRDARRDLAPE
jgi:ParB/RepB/Spo0J family partition protein